MKKIFALLLALVLVVSMIPMVVSADSTALAKKPTAPAAPGQPPQGPKPPHGHRPPKPLPPVHEPNAHDYSGYGCDTKYHWLECACGCKISMEPHIDPKDAADDYCICGYHFSDNADLVTLWVAGCPVIKNFNKNTTEYTLEAYTYKDVKEIKISTRTFDSEATVELPEDLTLKEGENKFEIKVTSENQKVTKIYTIIVIKESK